MARTLLLGPFAWPDWVLCSRIPSDFSGNPRLSWQPRSSLICPSLTFKVALPPLLLSGQPEDFFPFERGSKSAQSFSPRKERGQETAALLVAPTTPPLPEKKSQKEGEEGEVARSGVVSLLQLRKVMQTQLCTARAGTWRPYREGRRRRIWPGAGAEGRPPGKKANNVAPSFGVWRRDTSV